MQTNHYLKKNNLIEPKIKIILMKEILIVDYKINNTGSIVNAIKYLGFKPLVSDKPADILKSKNIILPGVGAFKVAMKFIKKKKN